MMDLLLIERRWNQMTLLNYVNPPTSLDVQEKMTLFPLDVRQKMTLLLASTVGPQNPQLFIPHRPGNGQ